MLSYILNGYLVSGLVAGDRLVFRTVILEDSLYVLKF